MFAQFPVGRAILRKKPHKLRVCEAFFVLSSVDLFMTYLLPSYLLMV